MLENDSYINSEDQDIEFEPGEFSPCESFQTFIEEVIESNTQQKDTNVANELSGRPNERKAK